MYKSSFHGKIDEIPGISVDNFERANELLSRAYFLSHCHSDHTQGLHTQELIEALEKTKACIYMSEPTAAIINDEKTDGRIMQYIKTLKLGTTSITLPADKQYPVLLINVTLIPAGHSFGSVMFLFKTAQKNVLFTGDFRMSVNDVSKYGYLHDSSGDPVNIDVMYVDTTFLGYQYTNFPKRSESIEYAVEEIRKWLSKDKQNRVALHTSAKYGYEFVFNEIFKELKEKVYVNEERWRVYSTLAHLVPGVTNEEKNAKIHICRNKTEQSAHTACLQSDTSGSKFLFIHFSAMKWDNFQIDNISLKRLNETRLDVCFPTHCSRSEILYFVSYFSPKKVVGFPKEYQSSIPSKSVDALKLNSRKRKQCSPKKVVVNDKKVDSMILRKIFEV